MTVHSEPQKANAASRPASVSHSGRRLAHQERSAGASESEKPTHWTRERLKAAIAAHRGPEGLDLAGADLSALDLQAIDLHGIVLSRWDEARGMWIAANLQRAGLLLVDLRGADLRHVSLQEADLWGADLRETDLRHAHLQDADLWAADLRGADLRNANLQGANLSLADLKWAKLESAD